MCCLAKRLNVAEPKERKGPMSTSEQIRTLESELETHKDEVRQDAALINDKIEETKAQLNPMNLVRDRPGLILLLAFLSGMGLYFFLNHSQSRAEEAVKPSLEKIGKPVARGVFIRAGRQAATRAVRR
jgi:hypothetical protein